LLSRHKELSVAFVSGGRFSTSQIDLEREAEDKENNGRAMVKRIIVLHGVRNSDNVQIGA
jgi:hypothetical protein